MRLTDFIRNNGISRKHIEKCCGISYETTMRRLKGKGEWKVVDLPGLSQALRVPQSQVVEMILEEERYEREGI